MWIQNSMKEGVARKMRYQHFHYSQYDMCDNDDAVEAGEAEVEHEHGGQQKDQHSEYQGAEHNFFIRIFS